jgi:hypothetical protein
MDFYASRRSARLFAPAYAQRTSPRTVLAFPLALLLPLSQLQDMPTSCHIAGCKSNAPHALEEQKLCVLHYTLSLEASCSEMRRETALGNAPHDRQREIMRFITESGERLARVATSGMALTDDLKARILSTFLTLMNLRENLDRASMRTPPGRSGVFR